jgi:large subunit ribosomal protein L1
MAEAKDKKLATSKQKTVKKTPTAKKTTSIKTVTKEQLVPNSELLVADEPKVQTAKAGKRSEKALKEVEEKEAKEERKTAKKEVEVEEKAKPKQVQNVTTQLERRSKGYRKSSELLEEGKTYSLKDAVELACKTSHVKFDATVELHIRLGVDPRQADQNLRDTVILPAGTGKTLRIAVFADPEGVATAKKAGADIAGSDEFLQQLDKGTIDFDVLIATPQMMAKLGKYARVLGPKGLMPNPKSGTVTTDIAKAVNEAKAGRVEYRVDSTGIVHVGVGKVSFGGAKLLQNAQAILNSIKANKPTGLKGNYVKSIFATTSMGPSISVDIAEI